MKKLLPFSLFGLAVCTFYLLNIVADISEYTDRQEDSFPIISLVRWWVMAPQAPLHSIYSHENPFSLENFVPEILNTFEYKLQHDCLGRIYSL